MENSKYTVTAALPYANGPLHLGHVAGVYLPADIFVRFLRLKGHDVAFVCGSDEHGAAITLRAKKEGITPQEIVDKYHAILKKSFEDFDITFDIFHRTSTDIHKKTAQDFFKTLNDADKFTQIESEQLYDEQFNQFLADRYITGECPHCGYGSAYGDQCEKCGTALSPNELINPVSTLSGEKPVMRETKHWYLPMEKHEAWLKEWIQEGKLEGAQQHDPSEWRKQVLGQCMSWIDGGLRPRAMTRDLDWGVKVPVDGAVGKVLYVWLDAPIGYISATKEWAKNNNKDWKDYWTGDRKLVHFIGKDNIVFHAIIFPILLKEHGGLILPDNVPASEFLNLEGDKFSTSRNWAVWLHEFLERYPDKKDALKYTLTAIAPESRDSEFTWNEFQSRVNNELADVLGNFVNRALVLTNKYYDGKVPSKGNLLESDLAVLADLKEIPNQIEERLYKYKIREAQSEAMRLARIGNKYLADNEPWKLIKTDPERVATIMHVALQITATLGIILEPFLPDTASKIRGFLGMEQFSWTEASSTSILEEGKQTNKPSILFSKIDDELVVEEQNRLKVPQNESKTESETQVNSESKPQKETITFEDFTKLDIRVGEIKKAEAIKKADRLLKLTVDLGSEERTIVSGIAQHYSPNELIGKKVSVLINLAPRKMRGVLSEGMILMAENSQGELAFIEPDKPFESGAEIR